MGSHNCITMKKYKTLKQVLKTPADDASAVRKFGVSKTTCRMVRNTADYAEYCERRFRYHGNPAGGKKSRSQDQLQDYPPMLRPKVEGVTRAEIHKIAGSDDLVKRELTETSATVRHLLVAAVVSMIVSCIYLVACFAGGR